MKKDLIRGQNGEDKVSNCFIKHNHQTVKNTQKGTLAHYDIYVDNFSVKIEVKNDEYAKKSGNIAIEVFNPKSNKASGLYITQADIWAHVLDDEIWISSPEKMKNFINSKKPLRIIEKAGDGNATILLYRKDEILDEIFTRVDELDKEQFDKAISEYQPRT